MFCMCHIELIPQLEHKLLEVIKGQMKLYFVLYQILWLQMTEVHHDVDGWLLKFLRTFCFCVAHQVDFFKIKNVIFFLDDTVVEGWRAAFIFAPNTGKDAVVSQI
jgi:hypothetical protein